DPAIGILKAVAKGPFQRSADFVVRKIDCARGRQQLARAQHVVKDQAKPQQKRRSHSRYRRQHETHWPYQLRGHAQDQLSFVQGLANQAKGPVLEIAQAAMYQLARSRGRARTEIVHLDEQYFYSAAGCVAGEARSVYAAADDGEVEIGHWLMIR